MKTYIYTLSKLLSIFQTWVNGLENLYCGAWIKPRCDLDLDQEFSMSNLCKLESCTTIYFSFKLFDLLFLERTCTQPDWLTDSKADTQADKQTNVLYSCGLLTTTIAQINRNIYVSKVKLSILLSQIIKITFSILYLMLSIAEIITCYDIVHYIYNKTGGTESKRW